MYSAFLFSFFLLEGIFNLIPENGREMLNEKTSGV